MSIITAIRDFRFPPRRCSRECAAGLDDISEDALKTDLIHTIGHRIAVEAAKATIETYAGKLWATDDRPGEWFDTSEIRPDEEHYRFVVGRAATFLGLCDLLDRVPMNPHLVRIRTGVV